MFGKTPEEQYRNTKIVATGTVALIVLSSVFIFSSQDLVVFRQIGSILANLWWVILPVPMWLMFFLVWDEYKDVMFLIKLKFVVLEIRPPSDVERSPKIMEKIITGIHDYTTLSLLEVYCGWKPKQAKYSLELVSLEGVVHYYIRCVAAARNHIEAQIYAFYPDAEIFEVEDYVYKIPRKIPNAEWDCWGTAFQLTKEDAYPLRTYREFQEEVTGKMVDPMASITEVLSYMGPGQYGWLQIIFFSQTEKVWRKDAIKLMDKIAHKEKPTPEGPIGRLGKEVGLLFGNIFRGLAGGELQALPAGAEVKDEFSLFKLTPQEQDVLKAIHDSISYNGYHTVVRYVYAAKKEVWDKPLGVASLLGALKQFNDANLNGLKTDNRTKTYAHYYFTEPRILYRKRKILNDYRGRDFAGMGYILTAPELATLYHFPDMSVKAPTIQRVEAKKGEAPFNLPTE